MLACHASGTGSIPVQTATKIDNERCKMTIVIPKTAGGISSKLIFGDQEIDLGRWDFEKRMELIEKSENYSICRHLGLNQILCWPTDELIELEE
jgi:hypothetical protein